MENKDKEKSGKHKKQQVAKPQKVKVDSLEKKQEKLPPKTILLFIVLGAVLAIVLVLSTVFALLNAGNTKIIHGVSIQNISVSNLTKEEAKQKLEHVIEMKNEKNITFKYEDKYETSINPEQIEVTYNLEEAIEQASKIGRDGNILTDNYKIIWAFIANVNIEAPVSVKEEKLKATIEDIGSKMPEALQDNSYYIEGENLIITKGKAGLVIDEEKLKQDIMKEVGNLTNINPYITISAKTKKPSDIDIDKIYQEIHKEPKDAYYQEEPFTIYPHVDGVDFAISKEEIQTILAQDKEEYAIPLKITHPKVTTNDIGKEAFPHLLSSYSTKYDARNENRSTNLQLASDKIDGTIIMPGETFSYNKVVGERTIAAGYKEAAIYENGKVVDGLGGGICQLSSTLYNTVVLGNLEIVSRSNHRFLTSYVSAGRDATVAYGSIDFQFKNTRQYPVKIVCLVKNGVAQVDLYGVREKVEYDVEIQSKILQSIPYTAKYIEDNSIQAGEEVIKQKGANGCKSETYKILKLNGAVVSKSLLSEDNYSAMERVVLKGTKGSQAIQTNVQTQNKEEEELKNAVTDKLTNNVVVTTNTVM